MEFYTAANSTKKVPGNFPVATQTQDESCTNPGLHEGHST